MTLFELNLMNVSLCVKSGKAHLMPNCRSPILNHRVIGSYAQTAAPDYWAGAEVTWIRSIWPQGQAPCHMLPGLPACRPAHVISLAVLKDFLRFPFPSPGGK